MSVTNTIIFEIIDSMPLAIVPSTLFKIAWLLATIIESNIKNLILLLGRLVTNGMQSIKKINL